MLSLFGEGGERGQGEGEEGIATAVFHPVAGADETHIIITILMMLIQVMSTHHRTNNSSSVKLQQRPFTAVYRIESNVSGQKSRDKQKLQ